MTDRAQFEAMLEALINEDQETAKEIFHNIVVGKSREIYEELLESDFLPGSEEEDEEDSDEEEESDEEESDEEEDDSENPFGAEDDEEEDDSENPFGDEEGEDDEMGDGDLEDRVMDLEDALEELKAEFEELLAGEENEPEHNDMFGGEEEPAFGDEEGEEDEFGADLGDEEPVKEKVMTIHHKHSVENPVDEMAAFMEYVNKVALPKHGDNGIQNKSVIDNMKNDMGGTTANILQNTVETKGGTQGGLLNPATKPQTGGNVNIPGAKSATNLKSVSKGHGAEKKGTGEKSVNDKSLFRGR